MRRWPNFSAASAPIASCFHSGALGGAWLSVSVSQARGAHPFYSYERNQTRIHRWMLL